MVESPRGTRDLEPEQMVSRKEFENLLRESSKVYGYQEILTPTFEHTQLFLEKSGPSIVDELYDFKDKSGRDLSLRPEFTASVMRMYAQGMREYPKPLKLFYFGPVFRYERPQMGRYREFWQFGTEIIGPDTPRADAENIALAFDCIDRSGLDDFVLKISDLEILSTFLREKGIDEEERENIFHSIDKEEIEDLEKGYGKGFVDDLREVLDSSLKEMENKIEDPEPIDHLREVMDTLRFYGLEEDDYEIDLGVVRGLDYYKGVVFEIEAEVLGAENQICGGGDYNLGDIFGIDISSKGFALGFDRTLLALEKEGKTPEGERPTCYIIPIGEEGLEYSYLVLRTLREEGMVSDIDLMDRSIGKALSYADKRGFKYSILIGEDEVEEKSVSIKDMDTGEQRTIAREDLINEVE